MTSGNNAVEIRKALPEDLDAVKHLADAHRNELGFVMRPALERSIQRSELFVAVASNVLVGFVEYHHRRDAQTTLYHIAVAPEVRECGIGRRLLDTLREEAVGRDKSLIQLKCPSSLPANAFYAKLGWQRAAIEKGKARSLVVWRLPLKATESHLDLTK